MSVLYNEFDPFAAAWLRELMTAGEISEGEVDERSIAEVSAVDLVGRRRVHLFAGIAGWELALRLAGWPADREVWTGSCPCQPYSSAGKRKGNADDRDLWPQMFRLVRECRPECVFGEQVEGAIRHGWLDRVCADLEGEGYAVGACVLGAHSVGAPHIRQRLFWVAHRDGRRCAKRDERERQSARPGEQAPQRDDACGRGATRGMAHAQRERNGDHRPGTVGAEAGGVQGADGERQRVRADSRKCRRVVFEFDERSLESIDKLREQGRLGPNPELFDRVAAGLSGVADANGRQPGDGELQPRGEHGQQPEDGGTARGLGNAELIGQQTRQGDEREAADAQAGATEHPELRRAASFWTDSALIQCRDGKARRVPLEPSVLGVADGLSADLGVVRSPCPDRFPLAQGGVNRVGLLRGFGNAIVPQVAAEFIRAFLETEIENAG